MSEQQLHSEVARFLYLEARLLDEQRWDEWLNLYVEGATYWIPAWDSEHELTDDPDSQLSLIYYSSRQGLEDRVYRVRTGRSSASTPLPRTCHLVTNVMVRANGANQVSVDACYQTLRYRLQQVDQFFGSYAYDLVRQDDQWKITRKKIVVLNDCIPTVLDFYSV
ncbi:MAG: aromatic-ring-hydroxylating dioxygenase subunit beta [Steroidobacteraceae bacterium]